MVYEYTLTRRRISDERTKAGNAADLIPFLTSHCFHDEEMGTESCWLVTLDRDLIIQGAMLLSKGCTDSCCLDQRDALFAAVSSRAYAVILAHNHPTGDPRPSGYDIKTTDAFQKACKVLGIHMLDHIILADGRYFSFADEREDSFTWPSAPSR